MNKDVILTTCLCLVLLCLITSTLLACASIKPGPCDGFDLGTQQGREQRDACKFGVSR